MDEKILKALLIEQKNEITAHILYDRLAVKIRDAGNSKVLKAISEDELRHYQHLKTLTGQEVKPDWGYIHFFYWICILFGLTFGVKLLEKAEDQAQNSYSTLGKEIPELLVIQDDEDRHEKELIALINEERLNYMGSVVLGLNDALVELTGALAGYTFAFQDAKMVALTGLITGISAALSMSASEYLSTKQDESTQTALKSALYTGLAYIGTVILLITPFLILPNPFISLLCALVVAILVILVFNYYISVARDTDFKKRFTEMSLISLGVAGISFIFGILVKNLFGIEI